MTQDKLYLRAIAEFGPALARLARAYEADADQRRDLSLRDWSLKRKIEALNVDDLRRLVREGIDSGPSLDAATVFARLRAKYADKKKSG